jgi:hypothetical protein
MIASRANPSRFLPASESGAFDVTVTNIGSSPTEGPITVVDHLPGGSVEPTQIFGTDSGRVGTTFSSERLPITCTLESLTCEFAEPLTPGESLTIVVRVSTSASPQPGTVENEATVSGGGAPTRSSSEDGPSPTVIGTEPVTAGLSEYTSKLSSNVAAAHPNLTTSVFFNEKQLGIAAAGVRDVAITLPPGLVGNPLAVPRCSAEKVALFECPPDAAVGLATSEVNDNNGEKNGEDGPFVSLIYNVAPHADEPAAFAFNTLIFPVRIDTRIVRDAQGQYTTQATASSVVDVGSVVFAQTTFWGIPAEHTGPGLDVASPSPEGALQSFGGPGGEPPIPFFRSSSVCAGNPLVQGLLPLTSSVASDFWGTPGRLGANGTPDISDANWHTATSALEDPIGCDHLSFRPTITVSTDNSQAGSPAGYSVSIHVPQDEDPHGLGTPDLQNAVVTLPKGAIVSPSSANGLQSCSDDANSAVGDQFQLSSTALAACPAASKIGTVKVATPLLADPLEGSLFLASPQCSPCSSSDAREGRMIRLLLEASGSGVVVKVAGTVSVDQTTGQLTTTFDNNPQFPFEDLTVRLDSGAGAPIANPSTCGIAPPASASLTPYSSPDPIGIESDAFSITGCSSPMPFAPSFTAGTTDPQAGAFSPLVTSVKREDREQDLSAVSVETPKGLLADIASVPLCDEQQANAGTCPESSKIGSVTVAAGAGAEPVYLPQVGKREDPVYLTGPYNGGPFGLSIVTHAEAGPFNLGDVVVRAAIKINPVTAQASVVSDPLPQAKDGIPFRLRIVNININRPNFTFNPTNCEELQLKATITGLEGGVASPSSRFQAANCATLPFKPRFTASTEGHTSKQDGASLKIKITSGGIGQANIQKVDLTIPAILPSRLTTIQKACTEQQFNANPAGCPPASDIASAVVHTPLLKSPLSGPVYFVSHGGAAFPDTEMMLQGEGVTLVLDGQTRITKGVTYSRFESVPDAPFTSFEFNAPEGPHSIFGSNGDLCQTDVRMPTTIVAQNRAVIDQSTVVEPEGCANRLTVLSHRVDNRTVRLKVAVPAAGKLTATARGLSKGSRTSKGRGVLTLTLKAKGNQKLNTKVKLTFTPSKGKKLRAAILARFGK